MKFFLIFILVIIPFLQLSFAQTLNQKDFIISTLIPDNSLGRTNLGVEYIFQRKIDSNLVSLALNAGRTSTTISNDKIQGFDVSGAINLYGEVLMSKRWNEYGGIKLNYGNFTNLTAGNNTTNSFFAGISTGLQPVIAKIITIKVSSDIGYVRNGVSNNIFYNNRNDAFYTGFAILLNLGVGIRL